MNSSQSYNMRLARLPVIFALAIYFTKTTNGQQCSYGNNLKLLLNNGLQSQQTQKNSGSMSVSSDLLNRNVMPDSNTEQQMKFQPQFNTNEQNPYKAFNNFQLLIGQQNTPQKTKIPLSTLNIVNGKLTLAPTGSISDPQFISAVQSLKSNSCSCGNQQNSIATVSNTPNSIQLTNSQSSSPSIVLTGSNGINNQPSPITLNLIPNVLSFQTNEAFTNKVPNQNPFQNAVFTFQNQQSNNQQPLTFNIIPSSPSSQSNTGTPNNLPVSMQTSRASIQNQPTNNQQSSQTLQIIPGFISTENSFSPTKNSQNTVTTIQKKEPLNTQYQIFLKKSSDDVINNQQIPLQIQSQLSPQNFPFYTPISSTSSNTRNAGQKSKQKSSSYLKSLLPLIINMLEQKNNEQCCHHCDCACVNNQKFNKQDAPTISSGYSNQINYGQSPKGDSPASNKNSEEMENDIPSENRRNDKTRDKNINVEADGSERTGADNSDYENSREDEG